MTEYTEAFKAKMVRRLVGPGAVSATALAAEVGLPQPTLSRWLRAAGSNVVFVTKEKTPAPSTSKPRRAEDWPPEERLRVVLEASTLPEARLGEFLRREGLHETTLREWRAAALEALGPSKVSRADSRRVRELERELRRKDKALAEAAALLVLQKKARAIWGDADDDTDPKSGE